MIYGTLNKRSKALNEGSAHVSLKERFEEVSFRELEQGLAEAVLDSTTKCSICGPDSVLPDNSYGQSADSGDAGENNSLALVPVEKEEAASSPISLLINELPELKPGWPLLRRSGPSSRKVSDQSIFQRISVVQWALQLPSRHYACTVTSEHNQINCDQSSNLDGESGAIVPVVTETSNAPLSPEHSPRRLPEELEGLHEKYSSTCRLFKYRELVSATSNFLPGMFWSILPI